MNSLLQISNPQFSNNQTAFIMTLNSVFEREALPQLHALRAFAMQLCRDDHWSDDLVQDTMLKAYTYFHTYKQGTNCRAWLFQICKNSFINDYRRKRYEPVAVDFLEETSSHWSGSASTLQREILPDAIDDGALQVSSGFLSDEVSASFDALPPDYQTALILCDIEEYTYEEIANFTQVPIGTVRSRIHRGRKMLAHRLTDYGHKLGYSARVKTDKNKNRRIKNEIA